MKRLSEVTRITGVTRRTLQEYAKIGLLEPKVEENGYWMYTDDDISTLLNIQMLRMADYKRDEIKEIIQADSYTNIISSLRVRLEEKQKKINGMLAVVDAMQFVMEEGYDPKVMQTIHKFSGMKWESTSIIQMYEEVVDYYSNMGRYVQDITFKVGYHAAELAAVKNLPIESPLVQERVATLYSLAHEMLIREGKKDNADEDASSEIIIAYLEKGGSMLALLNDDEIEDLKRSYRDDDTMSYYFQTLEESFGEGSVDFIINALTCYAREHHPLDEELLESVSPDFLEPSEIDQ